MKFEKSQRPFLGQVVAPKKMIWPFVADIEIFPSQSMFPNWLWLMGEWGSVQRQLIVIMFLFQRFQHFDGDQRENKTQSLLLHYSFDWRLWGEKWWWRCSDRCSWIISCSATSGDEILMATGNRNTNEKKNCKTSLKLIRYFRFFMIAWGDKLWRVE